MPQCRQWGLQDFLLFFFYMVRRLLNFSDDGLAVGLEGARNNHEAGKLQVTLQSIAAHLPDLKKISKIKKIRFSLLEKKNL